MDFDKTKIVVKDQENDMKICSYAAKQIRLYLKTFNQLPDNKQVFSCPDYEYYFITIDSIDPIENEIRCYVDFSAA